MNELICILGPTASGKTRYAVKMAHKTGGEIISADSRQVYSGMDIGTGKDLDDYVVAGVAVPYHLIDIAEPGTRYNIFEYQRDFNRVYNDIVSRKKQPILCGGSGLYIEVATKGYYLPEVPPDSEFRQLMEKKSLEELTQMLSDLKELHNTTDTTSKKRVIRALEIAHYQQLNPMKIQTFKPISTRFIGMDISRDERVSRINNRLKERLKGGMIEEVQSLLNSGIAPDDLIYYGLEYKYVTLYLTGKLNFNDMHQKLAVAIRQFANRQMTWFRGMERRGIVIEWVNPEGEIF